MNTTNASNGWRWLGLVILLLILLVLWLMGLGPSLSGSQAGCCGIAVAEQPIAPIVSVAQSPVDVDFRSADGKVLLSGEMPSEADRHNAFNTATTIFGAGKVIDKLTVWKSSTLPGWWQNLDKVLSWVKSGKNFGINQQDKKITLTGTVPDVATKMAQETALKTTTGDGLSFDNQMAVEIMAAPLPTPVASPTSITAPKEQVPPCSKDINAAISFNTGSAELSGSGKKQLDHVTKCLTAPTEVAGHTDNVGDAIFNKSLSKARANAVVRYITAANPSKGALLSATGYGETKPVADNVTAEGRAKNRRIEFKAR
ncbi:MAG: OmpA family protein [Methyloglobulus sp.]|nr:OmpA family protein [Methyloglobulus sp.]